MKRPEGDADGSGDAGTTDFERRLLTAAAQEEPSSVLRDRMARALGVPPLVLPTQVAAGTRASAGGAGKAFASMKVWAWGGIACLAAGGMAAAVLTRTPARPAGASFAAGSPIASVSVVPATAVSGAAVVAPSSANAGSSSSTVFSGASDVRARLVTPGGTATPVDPMAGRPEKAAAPRTLGDQIALVDAVRAAVAAHSGDRALTLAREYDTRFPQGSFGPEAAALRIEALVELGRIAEARALAAPFVSEHQGSPLADRVARLTGMNDPPH